MSADYAREENIPSLKRGPGMDYEDRDMSGYDLNNSMVSKAFGASPYGRFYLLKFSR